MAYYQKDQLSIKTRSLLADYFADLTLISQSIESYRNAFAMVQFFNGIQLFRYLDKDQKGYLIAEDFSVFVSDYANKILHYGFSWFDTSKTGQVTRLQFLEFLFPRSNRELRDLITVRMKQEYTEEELKLTLPLQLDYLRGLVLEIMQRQTKLIVKRRTIMNQSDYTLKAAMNCLDVQSTGWITPQDLYKFMKNNDMDVSLHNACDLLGVYDNDLNGKITIAQLQFVIQGLQRSESKYRGIIKRSYRKVKTRRLKSQCNCKSVSKAKTHQKKNHHEKAVKTAKKVYKQNTQNYLNEQQQIRINNKVNKSSQLKGKQLVDRKLVQKRNNKQEVNLNKTQTIKNKKEKDKNKKVSKIKGSIDYIQLKEGFTRLERQTNMVDEQLKRIQEQLDAKTQMQLERQLQKVKLKKLLKLEQKQRLKNRIQQLQILRKQQELIRLQQQSQMIKRMKIREEEEQQNRRKLQLQLQLERQRIQQIQSAKIRNSSIQQRQRRGIKLATFNQKQFEREQQRRIKLEEVHHSNLNRKLHHQLEYNRLIQLENQIAKNAHIANNAAKSSIQAKLYDREVRIKQEQAFRHRIADIDSNLQARLKAIRRQQQLMQNIKTSVDWTTQARLRALKDQQAIRLRHTQLDWKAQDKLRALYQQQIYNKQINDDRQLKQHEYFSKYRNYCDFVAAVADPLGIKEHIAQTDQFLLRSRQIRDQIKRDRVYSCLSRFPSHTLSKSSIKRYPTKISTSKQKQKEQNMEHIEQTPVNNKIKNSTNKKTQKTRIEYT